MYGSCKRPLRHKGPSWGGSFDDPGSKIRWALLLGQAVPLCWFGAKLETSLVVEMKCGNGVYAMNEN